MTRQTVSFDADLFMNWLADLNARHEAFYAKHYANLPYHPIVASYGRNYIKLIRNKSAWGFVALKRNDKKNEVPGDLLKSASWKAPAKHARGNVFIDGGHWDFWGPMYLK